MTQTITVSCKLQVPPNIAPEIDKTLEKFAQACNHILDTARKENVTNTTKLHHLTYKEVSDVGGKPRAVTSVQRRDESRRRVYRS